MSDPLLPRGLPLCVSLPWDGRWVVAIVCPCGLPVLEGEQTISLVLDEEQVFWAMHPDCVTAQRPQMRPWGDWRPDIC
jgi:hypothetical protein